jgi:hypothetical protein
MPARVGQGRSFRNGVRFSVQTRSTGSVAWRRLCVCCGQLQEQNKPESQFWSAFHRSSMLRDHKSVKLRDICEREGQ